MTTDPSKRLKCKIYGPLEGHLIFYLHGAPGSIHEFACQFEQISKLYGLRIVCINRFAISASVHDEQYYKTIADEILLIANGKEYHLIGFSIGTFIALQICRHLKPNNLHNPVKSLHLVASAAPLDQRSFISKMAGKMVFSIARYFPRFFCVFSNFQSILTYFNPSILYSLIFADVKGNDQVLVQDGEFRKDMLAALTDCFVHHLSGYMRDILAYVTPWTPSLHTLNSLHHVKQCFLWHGDVDTFTPLSMAQWLSITLFQDLKPTVKILPNCSHYSTLFEALPQIAEYIVNDDNDKKD